MKFIRKSLKVFTAGIVLFTVLSLLLALMICYGGFKETWAFAGLIVALSVDSFFLGYMQGIAVGKRGMLTGMISSLIFVLIILFATGIMFSNSFGIKDISIYHFIPIAAGGLGGLVGVSLK